MATENDKTATTATTTPAIPGSRVDRTAPAPRDTDAHTGGTTVIADGVVAKVAGIAAREIPGVHALGGGGARALGAIRNAINATDLGQGVKVEVGETQAAVDLTIVVEYPTPVHQVASQVRDAVAGAITRLVGLEVVEVNVTVDDVHIPGDDDAEHEESRVS
ncbi:Asp23/Gls24 family envelope stress response protein [Microbacterium sp. EYE_5]|uniref:Asp23/Gls24 family envelope stress response protein n=1 Tax=unclassified Microbacterium TaxID=2609290 RepID=UPI0020029F00|nr:MULTISPECIES: Asp23/Gls24 family envelope stress response protein [unclassified Microbacterium]MCK6081600.1 Asp23/Gls24 family envelope stress response protein [Microbacterium sp. EYE_382]MCK6086870.1 Asp23/Gls24 family envelope stress response protein [Microbacterium sp. EYE_384]MCK6123632.1 Asp23/Gls24 family envelope stress response protein [Microbacterium sp. EYE_80]MCK6126541.1 Asp23/Gls24 family envelope stress response protein [Microbacterium sp. EYE_79]MCK6142554.1 Asp23/Gls24 famil